MSYPKLWKSHSDQLDQLIGRGMIVTDRARAQDYLERIGYYRLSGYWFAFRERSEPLCLLDEHGRKPKEVREERIALDAFRAGTTFQNAVDLYVFDKQLRLLVMDALERIEVALRVDVSHTLGKLDPFAYLKPDLFNDEFSVKLDKNSGVSRHHEWLGKHAKLPFHDWLSFVIRLPRHPLPLVPSLADSAGTDQVTGEVERLLAALALGLGLVEMTQPDKPRSRHQHYRLTALGQRWLKTHPKNSNKS